MQLQLFNTLYQKEVVEGSKSGRSNQYKEMNPVFAVLTNCLIAYSMSEFGPGSHRLTSSTGTK